jgi:hypothetical protein
MRTSMRFEKSMEIRRRVSGRRTEAGAQEDRAIWGAERKRPKTSLCEARFR